MKTQIRTYRDLLVWQKGLDLARAIYRATNRMPRSEMFGLTNQMRRAAYSIPSNIAEGFGKHTRPEFIHGLRNAMGSLCELTTQYEIATSLHLIPSTVSILELLAEEDRLLQSLIMELEAKTAQEQQTGNRRARKT